MNDVTKKSTNSVAEEDVATMLPTVGLDGKPIEDSSIEHKENTKEIKKKIFEESDDDMNFDEAFMDLIELDDYQEIIQESSFNEEEDIFYNRVKYENGEINLLFITGYSGSGKSTMSKNEMKFLREVVDMDRIVLFTDKKDSYFINMGQFAKEFMIDGPGRKYREPVEKETLAKNASEKFRRDISRDLVAFAKKYAKENKRKKLVMEGVWVYRYIEPAEIDEYAVYIKGTSLKTSTERAIKRDHSNFDKEGKGTLITKTKHSIIKTFMASKDLLLRPLEKFQKYYLEKYKKQKNEIQSIGKKIKNETKGVIHDVASKIKKITESEENELEFSNVLLEYMETPDMCYDQLIEEGVGDIVNKIKERFVVSGQTGHLVVDIYMLKKKIKKCEKKGDTKTMINLKRELIKKQKELMEIKKTASPELQKEISKIEKTLEKNTKKFEVEESVNDTILEQSEEMIMEGDNEMDIEVINETEKVELPSELKRLDELRGKIEKLNDDLNAAEEKFAETGEKLYENKIKGITSKIEKLEKELEEKEKDAEKFIKESAEVVDEAGNRTLSSIDTSINYYKWWIPAREKDQATLESRQKKLEDDKPNVERSKRAEHMKMINSVKAKIEVIKKQIIEAKKALANLLQEKKALTGTPVMASVNDTIYDQVITEAAKMEDEIKSIVNTLNSKGYKVKYASPGHVNLRKSEDAEPDGVYYGKLYSDARVMFTNKYSFPNAPKYWHWRDVEGCSYLDITPVPYDKKDGSPNEAFKKWKSEYMDSLKTFVDDLKDNSDKDVKESVDEFANSFIEEMFEKMGFDELGNDALYVNESTTDNKSENILEELDNLLS